MRELVLKLWRSATQRVMSLTFAGMLVGLLVDVLIAARFGAGQSADALIIALSFPLFVDTVTRESAKFSLVPIFVQYRTERPEQYHRFVSGLLNAALVGGLGLVVIAGAAAPWIVRAIGPGLTAEGTAQATRLLWACGPLLVFAPIITVQGVVLNSEKKFSRVALRNAIAPGVVALTLLATWNRSDVAVWAAGAYSAGFATYFAILAIGIRRKAELTYVWSAWPTVEDIQEIRSALSWPSMGFAVRQITRLLERAIASLVAVGGVSAYYFAFRIFSGVQTIIGTSIATTGLPDLSQRNASGEHEDVRRIVRTQLVQAVVLALPAVVVALSFSETIIDLVYGRGAFGVEAIQRTERLLFWFSPGILFMCLVPPLNAVLYSMKAYRFVFWNMLLMGSLNVGLAWLLAQSAGIGLNGIAMAVSTTAVCSTIALLGFIRRAGLSLKIAPVRRGHHD